MNMLFVILLALTVTLYAFKDAADHEYRDEWGICVLGHLMAFVLVITAAILFEAGYL